jgi:hypothetical protein
VKIPYRVFPDKSGTYLYSARLNVSIALPHKGAPRTKRFETLVDSGATRCMFDAGIGRFLGLNIQSGELEMTQGIGGLLNAYIHEIALYVPGGSVNVRAAFVEDLPVSGLLGMSGFFDNFTVKFDQSNLIFEIERIYRA